MTTRPGTSAIALDDVTAEYFPDQPILRGLSLHAPAGKISLIIGPNGSGKSTALRLLAGFLHPREGDVWLINGSSRTPIGAGQAHRRSALGIAFVPQGHSVFPTMSVYDNLLVGAWPIRREKKRARQAIQTVLARYPVLGDKRSAPAGSLSGGQQRILELARALVSDPDVVLVDEPSAGVAPAAAATMYRELEALRDDGRTVVLVDQDLRPALAIADVVHVLQSGRCVSSGTSDELGSDLDTLVKSWLSVGGDATSTPSDEGAAS
ncbi:ABC transporter ATP-binding protein [Actinoallomurus soli]|uniref:ABC transporter ATP-binding protein n=1 Tax=Actinoallomurus soli TaxID=2952535 RepID=UPI002093727A|nr:ATP-binding cassette domain-containing protein [Actinoallomurus soli]MCO5967701.1 ATP-binding cassette domain-containing protein [Actinoallomurus soli]